MPKKKGIEIDLERAKSELGRVFALAENDHRDNNPPVISEDIRKVADKIFDSETQSLRETLLGCAIARLLDQNIDITLPYSGHGNKAFNGRTLDERIINPFLKAQQIPSSKGPYLATFRRSVKLDLETAEGIRDKEAYSAMLEYLSLLTSAKTKDQIEHLVRYLLYRFVLLREKSKVILARINRLSLQQLDSLITTLLGSKSGGRFPVLLSTAMLHTLKIRFDLKWSINMQGINASDAASKAGGDIDVIDDSTKKLVFSVEITERVIDKSRVVSTFTSKISPQGIEDYIFFYSANLPEKEAFDVSKQYFAQGHDINFLKVDEWIKNCLGTIGPLGRTTFIKEFVDLLDQQDIPADMKMQWNSLIGNLNEVKGEK